MHAELEEQHWWFCGRRKIFHRIIKNIIHPDKNQLIIDIGCGTGANIASLNNDYNCIGIDISDIAIKFAKKRFPKVKFICVSESKNINKYIPNASLILMTDMLEHVKDDFLFFSSVASLTKPGAYILLTVPANSYLWSDHDISLDHYRRYEPDRLKILWKNMPFDICLFSHFNSRLMPAVNIIRTIKKTIGRKNNKPEADMSLPPKVFNRILTGIFAGEADRLALSIDDKTKSYNNGISFIALLRRRSGTIKMQRKPSSIAPDLHDPESFI